MHGSGMVVKPRRRSGMVAKPKHLGPGKVFVVLFLNNTSDVHKKLLVKF